jgi:tetratricopeptide (TPR) repeat protein
MPWLWLTALLAVAFTCATVIEPAFRQWSRREILHQSVLADLMGDSRRLFANHFFIESDVYLHGGYYPSIFDRPQESSVAPAQEAVTAVAKAHHEEEEPGHQHDEHCAHDFLGKPRNWLDRFERNFFPSQHIHLGEEKGRAGEAREILPWIRLSADLDPQRVETYTVGAFWLRQMNQTDEALRFLREGLRANPRSFEILYDLGCCYEARKDDPLARNLWELALRYWREQAAGGKSPDKLAVAEILLHLARLEVRDGHRDKAVGYLEMLKKVSPTPQEVQKRIEEVKAGLPFGG